MGRMRPVDVQHGCFMGLFASTPAFCCGQVSPAGKMELSCLGIHATRDLTKSQSLHAWPSTQARAAAAGCPGGALEGGGCITAASTAAVATPPGGGRGQPTGTAASHPGRAPTPCAARKAAQVHTCHVARPRTACCCGSESRIAVWPSVSAQAELLLCLRRSSKARRPRSSRHRRCTT